MNWKSPAMTLTLVVAVGLTTVSICFAQEGTGEYEMSAEQQAEMAAWAQLAEPGEHHEHLQAYEGKWKTQITMWMTPGAEPMQVESEAEAKWTLGGRFLEWQHTGDFFGSPYSGRGFDGYNNADKRYESVWMDNFGTLMVTYTGECSDNGKTRVIEGSFSNPMAGVTIEQKNVHTWIDEDHLKVESYMTTDGETHKHMEMLYERQ